MENTQEKFALLNKEIYRLCSKKTLIHRQCIKLGKMECELLTLLDSIDKPLSMNELSRALKVSHSRITRIIDNLVKKKFVKRFPSKIDRRSWLAEITSEGINANKKALEEFIEIQKKLIEKLPQEKLDEIYTNVGLYLSNFNKVLREMEREYEF